MRDLGRLKTKTILLVEDEEVMRTNIASMLRCFFKEVFVASNGLEGLEKYYKYIPDLVMTDLKMPYMDGFDFLTQLKNTNPSVYTIIVSAHANTDNFLEAINQKVDRYLIKPITEKELFSAFEAYLSETPNSILLTRGVFFDIDAHTLMMNGESTKLNNKEYALLKLLSKDAHRTYSYEEIEYEVWGDKEMSSSALRSVVRDLRKKLGEDFVINISGVGYRLL